MGCQFLGDGCGSTVGCAILKLVFVVLAAAVHSVIFCAGTFLVLAVQWCILCWLWQCRLFCYFRVVFFVYGSAVCCAILKLCWLQQCTLFCYFAAGVCCAGCVCCATWGVSFLAAALQSVVLALAVSVLGLVCIVLAVALGRQFFGDVCGSTVWCAILKLVLAVAVHFFFVLALFWCWLLSGVYCAGCGSAGCFATLGWYFFVYGSAV